MQKKCTRCWKRKSVKSFYTDKRNSTWYRSYCKDCFKELAKEQHRLKKLDILKKKLLEDLEVETHIYRRKVLKVIAIWLIGLGIVAVSTLFVIAG